jgi:hypothetical protein
MWTAETYLMRLIQYRSSESVAEIPHQQATDISRDSAPRTASQSGANQKIEVDLLHATSPDGASLAPGDQFTFTVVDTAGLSTKYSAKVPPFVGRPKKISVSIPQEQSVLRVTDVSFGPPSGAQSFKNARTRPPPHETEPTTPSSADVLYKFSDDDWRELIDAFAKKDKGNAFENKRRQPERDDGLRTDSTASRRPADTRSTLDDVDMDYTNDNEPSDDDELPQGWIYLPAVRKWQYEPTGYKTSLLSEVHNFNKRQKNPHAHVSEEEKDELEKEIVPIDIQNELQTFGHVLQCAIGDIVYVELKNNVRVPILITDMVTRGVSPNETYVRGISLDSYIIEASDIMFEDVVFNKRQVQSIANRIAAESEINNIRIKMKSMPPITMTSNRLKRIKVKLNDVITTKHMT